jgi:AraC-like DNA-binding protein
VVKLILNGPGPSPAHRASTGLFVAQEQSKIWLYMQLNFIDIILLIGAGQGILIGVLLLHKYYHLLANRFLAGLMIIFSLILFYLSLTDVSNYQTHPVLMGFLSGLGFLAGPLHYLYARYLIGNRRKLNTSHLVHFSYYIIYLMIVFIYEIFFRDNAAGETVHEMSPRFVLYNWSLVIQCLLYMIATLFILHRYAREIKYVFSNLERIRMNWLRNITIIFTIGLSVFLLENILFLFDINLSNYFNLSSIIVAAMMYTLGYLGLFKSEIFIDPAVSESMYQISQMVNDDDTEQTKYSKSGLSPGKAKNLQDKLIEVMDNETPYTDSNLTLNKLAGIVNISAHNLSEILNIQLQQNFFDFVNGYRVEKVKKDLVDPKNQNLTLLAIALNAGFNSKSSFNTIFKKITGMTPSQYREEFL